MSSSSSPNSSPSTISRTASHHERRPRYRTRRYAYSIMNIKRENTIAKQCQMKRRRRYKHVHPLSPDSSISRAAQDFAEVQKNFYKEHQDVGLVSNSKVNELLLNLNLTVFGRLPPKPVPSLKHLNLNQKLLNYITKRLGYTSPTPIQAQAVPSALQGRDVLGITRTGSGKTSAFLWPLITHVIAQKPVCQGEGPIALILAATHELALRIYSQIFILAHEFHIRVVSVDGGFTRKDRSNELRAGSEIVIGLPHNIIGHVRNGNTSFERVTFVVIYEHKRMIEGYGIAQVRSIMNNIRADRQTMLFSTIFYAGLGRLAKGILHNPVVIVNGLPGHKEYTQHSPGLECFNSSEIEDDDD